MNVGSPPRRPSSPPGRSLSSGKGRRSPASTGPQAPLAAPAQSNEAIPTDLIEVGRIVDAYGLAGWVKISPHEAAPESLLRGARGCWLATGVGARPGRREIAQLRLQGLALVAQIEGCADRDAALALKGSAVLLSRADFPATEPGEYYWVDLVGCAVFSSDGTALGTVAAVEDFGADPVLRVVDAEGETLIPFVAAHVVSVELGSRRIVVDWRRDY